MRTLKKLAECFARDSGEPRNRTGEAWSAARLDADPADDRISLLSLATCQSHAYGLLKGPRATPDRGAHDDLANAVAGVVWLALGVADNVAERVLAHTLPGVHGTYNRYDYAEEKADALQRLAAKIESIINPPGGDNVVPFRDATPG